MLIGLSYDGKDKDGIPKWEGLNNFKFRKFFFGAFFQVSFCKMFFLVVIFNMYNILITPIQKHNMMLLIVQKDFLETFCVYLAIVCIHYDIILLFLIFHFNRILSKVSISKLTDGQEGKIIFGMTFFHIFIKNL